MASYNTEGNYNTNNASFKIARKIFREYISPNDESSLFKKIPMEFRDHPVIKIMEAEGGKVRYRGPRQRAGRNDWRLRSLAQSNCLKAHAETFVLYPHGRGQVIW
jgi:hypothetical protein